MNNKPHNPENIPASGSVTWKVNQKQAKHLIDHAIAVTPADGTIPLSTARLIAATIHRGPGSALSQFASTGEVDRQRAAEELEHTNPDQLPAYWRAALWEFLMKEVDDGRA
ncbi:hypothetical protein [Mycobacteroides abscessus]|uniref:hypothetical protein n=1 Tax=Mycobacteroides abscessus TaxID=36809 RepID=UPI0021060190|nr:hypothetical protein [Mycobacteroides abscessus]